MYQNLFPQLAHLLSANAGSGSALGATATTTNAMRPNLPGVTQQSFIDALLNGAQSPQIGGPLPPFNPGGAAPPRPMPRPPVTGGPLPPFNPGNPGMGGVRPMPPASVSPGYRPPGRGVPPMAPGVRPSPMGSSAAGFGGVPRVRY